MKKSIYPLLFIFISLIISLVICEISLRLLYRNNPRYCVHPPHFHTILKPLAGILPGVDDDAHFYTNSMGIRGDEFDDNQQYRILTMGGSTTECFYLDQTEAWPYLLEERLNGLEICNLWIGNIGASGKNTRDHIMHMKYLLPQYPKIDAIIVLTGLNDFISRLEKGEDYDPEYLNKTGSEKDQIMHAFSVYPFKKEKPFYKNTAIWELLRRAKYRFFRMRYVQDEAGQWYITERKKRKRALKILNDLPDLTLALEEYERNINTIIDIARERSIRLIFLTQPCLWKPDATRQEKDLCWLGWKGGKRSVYYSLEVLSKGMERYNDKLVEICKSHGVEYIEMARLLPKDTTVFYDDTHFSENGARMVAGIIFEYLKEDLPYAYKTYY